MAGGTGDTTKKLPEDQAVLPIPGGFPSPSGAPGLESQITLIDPGRARSSSAAELFPPEPEPQPAPEPRVQIPGYELLRELARGGMGVVYEAWSQALGQSVALKVVHPELTLDPDSVQRLEREVAAQARIRHMNVVRVLDTGRVQGCPWIALELVPGETLEQRIKRAGSIPARVAAAWTRALAEALAQAHSLGILHRDLKPANVLLGPDQVPRLTDFGLARLQDDQRRLTMTGVILGTPAYMAPEQAEGDPRKLDTRTDVYGLGAVLYEMLAGVPPYRGRSQLEVIEQVMTRDPEPPSAHRPDVDPALEAVCLRCLARAPTGRYQSMDELARALDELERGARGGPARPRWPLLVLPLLAAPVVVLGLLLIPSSQPPQPQPSQQPQPQPPADPVAQLRAALARRLDFPALLAAADAAERAGLLPGPQARGPLLPDPEEEARLLFASHARRVARDPNFVGRSTPELDLLASDDRPAAWAALARAIVAGRPPASPPPEPLAAWVALWSAAILAKDDLTGARDALRRALEADPGLWLVDVLSVQLELAAGDAAAAARAVERWEGRSDIPPPVQAQRAMVLRAHGWLEAAREVAEDAVRRAPDLGDAWFARATVRRSQDEPAPALRDLERAIELQGESHVHRLLRGNLFVLLNRWREAHGDLRRVLLEGPRHYAVEALEGDAIALLELGELRLLQELVDRNRSALSERVARPIRGELALRSKTPIPEHPEDMEDLGAWLKEREAAEDWRGVAWTLDRLLAARPRIRIALLRCAHARIQLGHMGAAAQNLLEADGLQRLSSAERAHLVGTLCSLGRFAEATKHAEMVLAEDPGNWSARFQLVQVRVLQGEPVEPAELDALIASGSDPLGKAGAIFLRARVRAARGENAAALEDLRALLGPEHRAAILQQFTEETLRARIEQLEKRLAGERR